jgi:hypothetical protein
VREVRALSKNVGAGAGGPMAQAVGAQEENSIGGVPRMASHP